MFFTPARFAKRLFSYQIRPERPRATVRRPPLEASREDLLLLMLVLLGGVAVAFAVALAVAVAAVLLLFQYLSNGGGSLKL